MFGLVPFLVAFFLFFGEGRVCRERVSGVGASAAAAVTGPPACWHTIVRDLLSECKSRLCGLGTIDENGDVTNPPLLGSREELPPSGRREK